MAKTATLTLPPELLQRHIEAFFTAEAELRAGKNPVGAELNGNACRVAARLDWLDVTEAEVGDLHPGNVTAIARAINEAIAAAYDVPGE